MTRNEKLQSELAEQYTLLVQAVLKGRIDLIEVYKGKLVLLGESKSKVMTIIKLLKG